MRQSPVTVQPSRQTPTVGGLSGRRDAGRVATAGVRGGRVARVGAVAEDELGLHHGRRLRVVGDAERPQRAAVVAGARVADRRRSR